MRYLVHSLLLLLSLFAVEGSCFGDTLAAIYMAGPGVGIEIEQ